MITSQLMALGLSEKEAQTYLTILKLGPSLASTIARHTKIKRTSVYDTLNTLIERNLVLSFRQGKFTYFAVDDIKKLYYLEAEKLKVAEVLVESLKNHSLQNDLLQINYYKGDEGYKDLYEDILKASPKEFVGFLHLENFYKSLDMKREDEWTQERVKKGIRPRLIMMDTPMARQFQNLDHEMLRETRLISQDKYSFQTTGLFYEDYVTLFDSTRDAIGIRIYNPALCEMQKAAFEMCWDSLS